MLRLGSWSRPAGGSPVRVRIGAPGSRSRFVVERWRAERGVESLFGGSKHAGRSVKRTLATGGNVIAVNGLSDPQLRDRILQDRGRCGAFDLAAVICRRLSREPRVSSR